MKYLLVLCMLVCGCDISNRAQAPINNNHLTTPIVIHEKQYAQSKESQDKVVYIYLENKTPVICSGHTALSGKLTYIGEAIGYGIPDSDYTTKFSIRNPQVGTTESAFIPGAVVLPFKLPMDEGIRRIIRGEQEPTVAPPQPLSPPLQEPAAIKVP